MKENNGPEYRSSEEVRGGEGSEQVSLHRSGTLLGQVLLYLGIRWSWEGQSIQD